MIGLFLAGSGYGVRYVWAFKCSGLGRVTAMVMGLGWCGLAGLADGGSERRVLLPGRSDGGLATSVPQTMARRKVEIISG